MNPIPIVIASLSLGAWLGYRIAKQAVIAEAVEFMRDMGVEPVDTDEWIEAQRDAAPMQ